MIDTARVGRSERLLPYIVVCFCALAAHALLLVNDGTYWDDWILKTHLQEFNWPELYATYRRAGYPIVAYLYWGLNSAGLAEHYRIVAFVAIVVSGLLLYRICVETGWLTRLEATGIAAISVVFPGYQTYTTLITLPYPVFYCLFLAAALLMLRYARSGDARRGTLLRLASLAFFFVSFLVASLLVFYFAALVLLFLAVKEPGVRSWKRWLKRDVLRHLDFVLLPFVYWWITMIQFAVPDRLQSYHAFNQNPRVAIFAYWDFVANAFYGHPNDSFARLLRHPVLWLAVLLLVGFLWSRVSRMGGAHALDPMRRARTRWIFAFGLFAFILGAFPYVAVGLSPTRTGWASRHALLMALPVAVVWVAALRAVWYSRAARTRLGEHTRFVAVLLGASVVLAFSLSTARNYVGWQARAIKDRAIIAALRGEPRLAAYTTFWIDDQYPLGGERHYRSYEWASIFRKAWGQPREARVMQEPDPTVPRDSASAPTRRTEVLIRVKPGRGGYSEAALTSLYMKLRMRDWIRGGLNLTNFLSSAVQIEVIPPGVDDCDFRPFDTVVYHGLCPGAMPLASASHSRF